MMAKFKKKQMQTPKISGDTPLKSKPMKAKRPVKKSTIQANVQARKAIAMGEVESAEAKRKQEQDKRSLYIKFTGDNLPNSHQQIKELHSDIKFVRTPRTAGKKNKENQGCFKYAFIEFSSEEDCVKAKNKLALTRFKGNELFVDYMGEKSKHGKKS